ncbi:restriction endonuclease [Halorussus halophilus]|uniref:restriction endonuclease n=1 Tax=Halorussus halophilus TaxID=2650975 RepID=UPI00130126A4|nr:restriction endonuclease [Halorussus halophilus]
MLQSMDKTAFGQFVAALWDQQGWQTQLKQDDGKCFVAVQRPQTGEEGLLWAVPASAGEVGGQQVQQFASLCQNYGVEESAIVAAGSFSQHAEKVAQGSNVDMLDGDTVQTLVEKQGLTDLLKKHAGESGGTDSGSSGDGDTSGDGDSPLAKVRATAQGVAGKVGGLAGGDSGVSLPVSGTAGIAVVLVVALLAAGVLFGPSLPFLGGGGDAPIATAATPTDENATTLYAGWNAERVDSIDPNESDDRAYYPPKGEQFVVVQFNFTNEGESDVPLNASSFKLRTENRTYGHQPLAGQRLFAGFTLGPGERYLDNALVFSIPKGADATLVYDSNVTGTPVNVEFERDTSLPTNVSEP